MKNFLIVVAFSLLTISLFAVYANYGIPEIVPAPPPKEEKLDLGAMTMESFVALGERIVNGKGTCTLCHNAVGGRAPLLEQVVELTKQRLADEKYEGEAEDLEGYLMESMVEPSAYVVVGFGKKGTNDTVSPMPDVSTGSIGLSEAEMAAVIAYLQESGGAEITVEIPTDADEADEEDEEEQRTALTSPEEIVSEFTCGACHIVAGEEGDVGPDLTLIGGKFDRAYLRRSILDPNADIAKGYEADQMPPDYGSQLYASELELLLDYLASLK